jgi:signal transduction histidine kinase/DNA-binding response OmpR family regulator
MKTEKNSNHGIGILIAEDSRTQAAQLGFMLEQHGYQVTIAANGKLALKAAQAQKPALLISDIVMPEMDGYELCKAIKSDERLRDVPVILVTTLSDSRDVIRGLECGADNFIRKPYDERYLLSRIEYLLMNLELHEEHKMQVGVEIRLGGQKYFITSERHQILDLLISTYEQAIHINDELKQRQKELTHSNQVIQGLYGISEGLNQVVSEQAVAETALERALKLPGIKAGWISIQQGESGFRLVAARNLPPALSLPGALEGSCECRRKLLGGELGGVSNILTCERLAQAQGGTSGLRCHASVPFALDAGRTLGIMNLAGEGEGLFNEDELKVLHSVGQQLAVALERARLHEHLEQLVEERTAKLAAEVVQRKQAEAALRQLNDELEQRVAARTADMEQARNDAELANKAKSSFLAAMSHEIRTPMNGVVGMVDVLHQTSLKGYQVEMVDLIRESAYSLLTIIDDILDFSKIEAGKLEVESAPMSVADVVEKVCGMLDRLAEKNEVELTLFTDPAIPEEIMCDQLRLRQVLVNLVNNAIKFSSNREHHGRVSVRAVLVGRSPEQVAVEVRVADNGIGMDKETQSGLFTPFVQADVSTTRRFGGTGLGLSISRQLMELMGGEIMVQSEAGTGSTFTVRLPFVPLPDVGRDSSRHAVGMNPDLLVTGLSCLVVGDHNSMADDLATYLAHAGAVVMRATDMAAARMLAPTLPSGLCTWVIDTGGVPLPPDELRAIARALPEYDSRFVVIGRGQRREPQKEDAAVVLVDGNVLTCGVLLRAVAIAAGKVQENKEAPLPGKGEAAFRPPSRDEALRLGRLVLVAEDNITNQKVILRQLALLGFAADVADNGRAALQRWRGGGYALLLSDLHMPEMDGYQLTAVIRAEEQAGQRIPIVALTANALKGEAEQCRAADMDDYLSKPAQLADLQAVLEKWLPAGAEMEPDSSSDVGRDSSRHASSESREAVGLKPDLPAASVPLDVNVLKELVGGDEAVVRNLLHDFRISVEAIAAELRAACAAGQTTAAAAAAHKLKSSSRSVGALALGDLCDEMERAGKNGDTAALATLLPRFEHELVSVERYLDGY